MEKNSLFPDLRVLGLQHADRFDMVCLETDIAVSKPTQFEAEQAMIDALTAYFRSFTPSELESRSYLRPAPMFYRLRWTIGSTFFRGALEAAHLLTRLTLLHGSFDPSSQKLKLA